MEGNKYYTPTIEEFHVGFEYLSNNPDYEGDANFVEAKIESADDLRIIMEGWKYCYDYKVKYLDREDIEAEGFKMDSGVCDFIKDELQVEFFDGKVNISRHYGAERLFFGVIKNKSEFKKILKMIGV